MLHSIPETAVPARIWRARITMKEVREYSSPWHACEQNAQHRIGTDEPIYLKVHTSSGKTQEKTKVGTRETPDIAVPLLRFRTTASSRLSSDRKA